jgi:hypothetical protein
MSIIENLPPDMAKHVDMNYIKGFDLTRLEQPYITNKNWYVEK